MMVKDTIASSSLTFAILVESGRMQEVWRMLMGGRGKGVILLLVVAIVSRASPCVHCCMHRSSPAACIPNSHPSTLVVHS